MIKKSNHKVFEKGDFDMLKAALDKHMAVTKEADPVQNEKRKQMSRKSKENSKEKKPKEEQATKEAA